MVTRPTLNGGVFADLVSDETLALCMPCYDNVNYQAWASHVAMSAELGRWFSAERLGIFVIHKLPQPHAQNYMFQSVLENKFSYAVSGRLPKKPADWILWIEDDVVVPVDAFQLLREQADPKDRRIMHGLSFDRMPPYSPSMWQLAKDGDKYRQVPIQNWEENTVYKLYHSGTCCSLIHTSVFHELPRPWLANAQPFEPGCEGVIPCTALHATFRKHKIPVYGYTGCVAGHVSEPVVVGPELSRRYGQASSVRNNLIPKIRQYKSQDAYVAHQKAKTLSVKAGTCEELGRFDSRVAMFRKRLKNRFDDIGQKLNILCLGARRGEEVKALQDMGHDVIGVDLVPFPPYVEEGDFNNLTYKDGEFDVIFSNSVDHTCVPEQFASEITRVLKPGGLALLHLTLGCFGDEMAMGLETAGQLLPFFKDMAVLETHAIPEYGGGINWELVLQK